MVKVLVPATSANLGPGFDFLGLALELYNKVEFAPEQEWIVTAEGHAASKLTGRSDLLVCQAIRAVFSRVGRELSGARVHLQNNIPDVGGLGSSASAIVGGLAAANAYLGSPLSKAELLQMATALEGHPDNAAPAIFGGLVGVYRREKKKIETLQIPFPAGIKVVLAVPELKVSTTEARRLLPKAVPLSDAVFNLSHTGLLVGACFAGRADLLRTAMQDRLHQEKRATLIPGFREALKKAEQSGAYGAALSGSGPTIIAFAPEKKVPLVGEAMKTAFAGAGVGAEWLSLEVNTQGYIVTDA
jgi:homoserine kinase